MTLAAFPTPPTDWLELRGCLRKRVFPSKKEAKRELSRAHRAGLRPYECSYCGHWHVGHPNPYYLQEGTPNE